MSVPWQIAPPPTLASPTPMPTINIVMTATVAPTATPEPTATPVTPIPTSGINATDIVQQLGTLQAMQSQTPAAFATLGTQPAPVVLAANAGLFFGYAQGFTQNNFGKATALVNFFFFAIVFLMMLSLYLAMVPLVSAVIGFFRKVISFVLDFIPG